MYRSCDPRRMNLKSRQVGLRSDQGWMSLRELGPNPLQFWLTKRWVRSRRLPDDAQVRWDAWTEAAECSDTVRGADIHPPVDDGRRDELVAGPECVPPGGRLVRVVELTRQIPPVVGVQHPGVAVFDG